MLYTNQNRDEDICTSNIPGYHTDRREMADSQLFNIKKVFQFPLLY
jgi:hypothetical protein